MLCARKTGQRRTSNSCAALRYELLTKLLPASLGRLVVVVEVATAGHGNLGADVHCLQLLEQQLACIRQVDLVDAVSDPTVPATPAAAGQRVSSQPQRSTVAHGTARVKPQLTGTIPAEQATHICRKQRRRTGPTTRAIAQSASWPCREQRDNHAPSHRRANHPGAHDPTNNRKSHQMHATACFIHGPTKAKTSLVLLTECGSTDLSGLSGHGDCRPRGTSEIFVLDHVLQSLVVHRARENVRPDNIARQAAVQKLLAVVGVSCTKKIHRESHSKKPTTTGELMRDQRTCQQPAAYPFSISTLPQSSTLSPAKAVP